MSFLRRNPERTKDHEQFKKTFAFRSQVVLRSGHRLDFAATPRQRTCTSPSKARKPPGTAYDRYDFIMDDATGAITPMTAPANEVTSFGIDVSIKDGKRRGVVVVPKKAAPGNPWSWQACYWNHQPQTEVELLRRGFHIAFVAPDPVGQGKAWDLWYKFMTENHGLAKKSAFIGMSKGGVNEFNWGGANPDKVACIYADNPGGLRLRLRQNPGVGPT